MDPIGITFLISPRRLDSQKGDREHLRSRRRASYTPWSLLLNDSRPPALLATSNLLWGARVAVAPEKARTEAQTIAMLEQRIVTTLLLGAKHGADRGIDPRLLLAQRLATFFEHVSPELAHLIAVLLEQRAYAPFLLRIEVEAPHENAKSPRFARPIIAQDRSVPVRRDGERSPTAARDANREGRRDDQVAVRPPAHHSTSTDSSA
jgi:hypothetical protein